MHKNIETQLIHGRDASRVYLHIGKTGGTSFRMAAKKLAARFPERVPVILSHAWTVPMILESLPQARISFVMRDPLERAVSGFMSRLRAGRPTYTSPWTTDEAVAFLYFPDVRDYLGAILAEDERLTAAVHFADRAIQHLQRGYRYHVPDCDSVRDWAGPIGRVDNLSVFATALLGDGIQLEHAHWNPTPAKEILAEYGDDEQSRLREHYADEYEVFHKLSSYVI